MPNLVRYRQLVIDEPLAPPDSAEFAKVEEALGLPLPLELRAFLSVTQGITVEYAFDVAGETLTLGSVFRVGKNAQGEYGYGTLLGELQAQRQERALPRNVLPFAQGGGDAWLYVDLTLEGTGPVVVFLEGLPEWTGRSPLSRYVEVAPSLNAFLDSLYLDEEGAIANLENALHKGRPDWINANVAFLELALPKWKALYPRLADEVAEANKRGT